MNLGQMRARCQTRFHDASGSLVTNADWNAMLVEAQQDVYAASPWWPFFEQRTSSLVISAQTAGTTLPPDAVRVNSVFNSTDGYLLLPMDGRADYLAYYPTFANSFGNPYNYRVSGTTLEVYPRPASNTTLTVEYMAPPAVMVNDGDTPPFPSQYHPILIEGALAKAYLDDEGVQFIGRRMVGRTMLYAQNFEAGIERMKNDLLVTQTESYYQIPDVW